MNTVFDYQIAQLQKLAAAPDDAIDTSDIPEITNWNKAERGRFYQPNKQQVTLLIDSDVLSWFKTQGDKYQTNINLALREYFEAHNKFKQENTIHAI